uniref:Myosin_tail_1 domain-containing protein n=1 Tax=Panagrellus redivivus TaxID=6233 RepID=A0A7E4VDS3_PANRE
MLLFSPSAVLVDLRKHRPGEKLKVKMHSDSELDKSSSPPGSSSADGSRSRTASELKQVPSDLHKYRKRIDSSIQDQRKHREILQGLQDKVMRYRQKAAEAEAEAIESARGSSLGHGLSLASLMPSDLVKDSGYGYASTSNVAMYDSIGGAYSRSTPGLAGRRPSVRFAESLDDILSKKVVVDDPTTELYKQRLKEEQYRNNVLEEMVDTLKRQAESTAHANETLTADLVTLHDTLSRAEHQRLRIAEVTKQREQKIRREKDTLQRHFYDLSMEIGALRRKLKDLRHETETELLNYKAEFDRGAKTMDSRMKHFDTLQSTYVQRTSKEHDFALEEVMRKYDEAMTKSISVEHERNETARKVIFLESSLKRAQEERDRVEDALKKIHQLPEVAEALGRRTRSLSPAPGGSLGHETIRHVRLALHAKTEDIASRKREAEHQAEKLVEAGNQIQKLETEKRQLERTLKEERASKAEVLEDKDIVEKQLNRLNEKYEKVESDRNLLQGNINKLNDTITELKLTHQAAIDELRVKNQLEWDERWKQVMADHDQVEEGYNHRLQRARQEGDSLRADVVRQRDAFHELQNELTAERRKLAEKDSEIAEAHKKMETLSLEIDSLGVQLQAKEYNIIQLQKENLDYEHKEKLNTEKLDELAEEKNTLMQENNGLTSEISQLRGEIEELVSNLDSQSDEKEEALNKAKSYKDQLSTLEKINTQTRTAVADLEMKLEGALDRYKTLERELADEKAEVAKSVAIIGDLMKEKTDIINIRESLTVEISDCKRTLNDERAKRQSAEAKQADLESKLSEAEERLDSLESARQTLMNKLKESNSQVSNLKESLQKSEKTVTECRETIQIEIQKHRDTHDDSLEKLRAEHLVELNRLEADKALLRSELAELRDKLDKLLDTHAKAEEEHKLEFEQLTVQKSDLTLEVGRLKQELIEAGEHARQDLLEAMEARSKDKTDYEARLAKADKDLQSAEEDIREGLGREAELRAKIEVLEGRLAQGADMVLKLKRQLEDLDERSEELSAKAESERETLRSQIEQLNANLAWAKQEKEENLRKIADLDKSLQVLEAKTTKQQSRLKDIDDEIHSTNTKLRESENANSELKFKLRDVESHLAEITDLKDKFRTLHQQEETRNHELTADLTAVKKQLTVTEAKLQDADQRYERRLTEMRKVNAERRNLELSFTDKSTEVSSLNTLIKQYEHQQNGYLKELSEEKERSMKLEQENIVLRGESHGMKEELAHAMATLEKKTASNQAVINDLLDNYRQSEKGKLEAMRELEERGAEIEILRHKLDLCESKKREMEDRIVAVEREKDSLLDKLSYYERSAKKVLSFARTQTSTTTRTRSQGPSIRYGTTAADLEFDEDSALSPRSPRGPTLSIPDLTHVDSISRLPRSSSHLADLDIQNSMEVTFRILKDRIAALEADKSQMAAKLRAQKAEINDVQNTLSEERRRVNELQRTVHDLTTERASLDVRLSSTRQMLVSREEDVRARDQKEKAFRAKMASSDMHVRDKEARLKALQNEVAALKVEVANLEEDKKALKDAEGHCDRERRSIETQLKEVRLELDVCQRERASLAKDKETLTHRLKETEQNSTMSLQRCSELERTIEHRQQSLARIQQDESVWKSKFDSLRRTAPDAQQLELRLESAKIELESMTQKWRNAEADRETMRRELLEMRSKYNTTSLKMNDLQLVITELTAEKKRCVERIEILEKYERDNSTTTREVRRELDTLKAERLGFVAEIEEHRRQLHKTEIAKKELEAQVSRLERERTALKRHVEAVELDKQRIESAVRQTAMERHALDKSLNAMEKENSELYKNCSLLQSQLNQLERENTTRAAEANTKKKMQFEAEIHKLNNEKRQLEKLIEHREQNYIQKIKMLESQVAMLREQLEQERRRRREFLSTGSLPSSNSRRPGTGSGGAGKPPFRV